MLGQRMAKSSSQYNLGMSASKGLWKRSDFNLLKFVYSTQNDLQTETVEGI